GAATLGLCARCALRIRVSISPKGSVIDIIRLPLPARLDHAGDLAGRGELAQCDARQLELAIGAARAAGQLAAIADACLRAVARHLAELELGRETLFLWGRAIAGDGLEARALAGHLL